MITNLDNLSSLLSIGDNLEVIGNEGLTDLCGLQTLLINEGLGGFYNVSYNSYNPTQQDIIDGNCSI